MEKKKPNPPHRFTKENAAELGRKGGLASGEAKRQKKALKSELSLILSTPIKDGDAISVNDVEAIAQLKGKNLTVQTKTLLALAMNAMKGDNQAINMIYEISGEKAKNEIPDEIPTINLDFSGLNNKRKDLQTAQDLEIKELKSKVKELKKKLDE